MEQRPPNQRSTFPPPGKPYPHPARPIPPVPPRPRTPRWVWVVVAAGLVAVLGGGTVAVVLLATQFGRGRYLAQVDACSLLTAKQVSTFIRPRPPGQVSPSTSRARSDIGNRSAPGAAVA